MFHNAFIPFTFASTENDSQKRGKDWQGQVRSCFNNGKRDKKIKFKSIKPKNSKTGAWTLHEDSLSAANDIIAEYSPDPEVVQRSFCHPLPLLLRGYRSPIDEDFKTAVDNFRSYYEALETTKDHAGGPDSWWPSGRPWVPGVGVDVPKGTNTRSKDKRVGELSRYKIEKARAAAAAAAGVDANAAI